MPVVTKYVVERNGVEKMTFSSKAEADQYDKLLDTAESLEDILHDSAIIKDDQLTVKLAMYLAQNKDELLLALGNKRKKKPTKEDAPPEKGPDERLLEDLVIEPDESSYVPSVEENNSDYDDVDSLSDYNLGDVYDDSNAA